MKTKPQPFIGIAIGGRNGDLPPDTEFLHSKVDPPSGRTIVYVPVILNETPQAGKPYTSWDGTKVIPSIVGRTDIKECTIQMPGPLGEHCTIKGFASLQIAGLTPAEITERWDDAQAAADTGTTLVYDWNTREYKVVVADETDDITTTHAFDSRPPNFEEVPASEIQQRLSPDGKLNQTDAQNEAKPASKSVTANF